MKKQILSNVGSNYAMSFFGMALGFLLVPFLVSKLGKDAYGLTVLAESTVAFFEIITISVRIALSRHATFSLSKNDLKSFIEYLSTGRVILYFSAAIVMALGIFVSVNFTHFFKVPAEMGLDSKWLFFFVCLGFTISIPNIIFWSVLYAKQRFDLINFSMSFGLIMRAVCLFLFFSYGPPALQNLTAYGVIFLIMTLAQNFMIYFWHKRVMPEGLRVGFGHFKKERVREILSFSFHTSLSRVSQLLYQETAMIIINVYWGPTYNAIYSVAMKLPNMMRRIFIEPTWALAPTFTDLVARGERERVEQILYVYSKALSIITFPMAYVMMLCSSQLINAWVGPDFKMAAELLPYFSVSLFIGIPLAIIASLPNAYGKVKAPSIVSLFSAIVNLALCLIFGEVMNHRLFGIAWASLITSLGFSVFFLLIYSCRLGGISVRRYWSESFTKPFALSSVFMVGGYYAFSLNRFHTFKNVSLIASLTGLTIAYYLASYLIILDAKEKKHIHDILNWVRSALNKAAAKTVPGDDTL